MGKFSGTSERLKIVAHPVIKRGRYRTVCIPEDYKFYGNGAEKEKWDRTMLWLRSIDYFGRRINHEMVLEAFAGVGILTSLYLYFGYRVIAIEQNHILANALIRNFFYVKDQFCSPTSVLEGDNLSFLPLFKDNDPNIKIIDLDSYGSCVPQIREAARIIKTGFLFVTSGDIYAGSRFKNWSFTKGRYGIDFAGPTKDYPAKVVYPFIQREFQKFGKSTELSDHFSFPTICRLCIEVA